jgi:2-polyprenyl-3-methyl-5-hydroxy-6-metoxy-1,4-benzoquinol methylase
MKFLRDLKLKRRLSLNSKRYYRDYIANKRISPCNEQLVQDILSYKPRSVFEFGCNRGKLLQMLKDEVDCYGIDISEPAVEIARKNGLNVDLGDETMLPSLQKYDIVFTSSVLDHIEHIDEIVREFRRIANMAIIIAETNTPVGKYYYAHDYEALGFAKTGYKYVSHNAKIPALYEIYHLKVEPHA